MTTPIEQLYEFLTPDQHDTYLFSSPEHTTHLRHIFGGQVLAQALSAATRTVPEERQAHSMHAYFLRSGDNRKQVMFHVEPLRDGGSFSTRHVVAKQDGKAIFNVTISFKIPEQGLEHQPEAPDFPSPDSFQNDLEYRKENGLSLAYADRDPFSTFDYRTVGSLPDQFQKGDSQTQGLWIKTADPASESVLMQQCLVAYLSDYRLMTSAIKPYGLKFWDESFQSGSLDHAIWFHRPFKFDQWLYYDMVGPVCSDARGLNYGRFYDSSGQLVASTVQEGLMRVKL